MSTNRLFIICPSDALETVIYRHFKGANYFFSVLANSHTLSREQWQEIQSLVKRKSIDEVIFVLSDNNPIIQDELGIQRFSRISSLGRTNKDQVEYQLMSRLLWQRNSIDSNVLAQRLQGMVEELRPRLRSCLDREVNLGAKIYFGQWQSLSCCSFGRAQHGNSCQLNL